MNFAIFGQMIIFLDAEARILTQVAGYHTSSSNSSAVIITREDIDWFLKAMEDVSPTRNGCPGAALNTVSGLTRRVVQA